MSQFIQIQQNDTVILNRFVEYLQKQGLCVGREGTYLGEGIWSSFEKHNTEQVLSDFKNSIANYPVQPSATVRAGR
ncbi:hypothetical protein GCM10028803_04030 [Larkinella knui]|uniref:Uncharacterized protein n=1 Tax=Larkinella knui TaxID=2025310 RepID=A0A3P1CL41_9BACT|nr:hypothetical protein [Larkinella knui]RRB13910.1 hypothetical protein EHT87_16790 [Larkinella knui]